jgi:hypothetical protein
LIRSAASDAAANLLSFIPSLGTREAFTFGPGVALPTRMSFGELPAALRPNSEAAGNTKSEAGGANFSQDLIPMVIERWRSASATQRTRDYDAMDNAPSFEAPAIQRPAAPPAPAQVQAAAPQVASPSVAPTQLPPLASSARTELLRSSLLRRPLDAATLGGAPPQTPPTRPR